jgi:hypothetical protein
MLSINSLKKKDPNCGVLPVISLRLALEVSEYLSFHNDVNELTEPSSVLKLHDPANLRKKGVIPADADIQAGLELGSSLSYQDRPTRHILTGEALDAQPFGLAVASVPRTSNSLFVSHSYSGVNQWSRTDPRPLKCFRFEPRRTAGDDRACADTVSSSYT